MKTLSKLNINPGRIIKDDELKSLRGGWCGYMYVDCPGYGAWSGPACDSSMEAAYTTCNNMWGQAGCTCHPY